MIKRKCFVFFIVVIIIFYIQYKFMVGTEFFIYFFLYITRLTFKIIAAAGADL